MKQKFYFFRQTLIFSLLFITICSNINADSTNNTTKSLYPKADDSQNLTKLEQKIDQVNSRLNRLESLLTQIQSTINQIQQQLSRVQVQVTHIDKINSWFEQPTVAPQPDSVKYTPAP